MKKITTKVTYKVPEWEFCNCSKFGEVTKDKCRFCVKHGKGFVCALHNMPLNVVEGTLIRKYDVCRSATAGFKIEIEEAPQVQIDPKTIMKLTMQEYRKTYKQLIAQGYTDTMADKLAMQVIMGD